MEAENIEDSALKALFWKEEILQVMYWMDGEGLGSKISVAQVLNFINTNSENLLFHINKLLDQDLIEAEQTSITLNSLVSLSKIGKTEAGKHFAEAFQGLQKAGHGECGPDCEFCYGADGVKLDDCVHNCASQN